MLTVITDDLAIDMEQVLYLSKGSHSYTLRFRGGEELELTLAEWQALMAKLKVASTTLELSGAVEFTDNCCNAEIDPDEYEWIEDKTM